MEISRFSADTADTAVSHDTGLSHLSMLSRALRVSLTMRLSIYVAHPEVLWGDANRFEYLTLAPNLWLCVGLSNGPLVPYLQSYYGGDQGWFRLGQPVAVWQDAVVVECSVPGRLLVIPNHFFDGSLPLWLRLYRAFAFRWLPSIARPSV